jgi:hypothetical protein
VDAATQTLNYILALSAGTFILAVGIGFRLEWFINRYHDAQEGQR